MATFVENENDINEEVIEIDCEGKDSCACLEQLHKLDDLDYLPLVAPRYHGPECMVEISVLEKHDANCLFRKGSNRFRNPIDDKCGSFEVIGRLVYPYCDRIAGGIRESQKSSMLNSPDGLFYSQGTIRNQVNSKPVLRVCDDCTELETHSCCCADSTDECCSKRKRYDPNDSSTWIEDDDDEDSEENRTRRKLDCCYSDESECCAKLSKSNSTFNENGEEVEEEEEEEEENYECCKEQFEEDTGEEKRWKWSQMPKVPRVDLQCPCEIPSYSNQNIRNQCAAPDNFERQHQPVEYTYFSSAKCNRGKKPKMMTEERMGQIADLLRNKRVLRHLPEDRKEEILKLKKFVDYVEPTVWISKSKKKFTK